jgi:ferredoxin
MIRIIQQRGKCIGCNACVEAAISRWRMSRKDGKCTLVGGREKKGYFMVLTGDDELECNRRAELHCPVRIIKVEKMKEE